MKRLSLLLLAVLITVLAACGPSPKERAKEFVKYLPKETTSWKKQEKKTVELLNSTITSRGHIALQYKGPSGVLAYIVVDVYPSDDAAHVAKDNRERELLMMGLDLETNWPNPEQTMAKVVQAGRVRYALFENLSIVVEIDVLAEEDDQMVSDDIFDELLAMVRGAYEQIEANE